MGGARERRKSTNDVNTVFMYKIKKKIKLKPLHPVQGRSV